MPVSFFPLACEGRRQDASRAGLMRWRGNGSDTMPTHVNAAEDDRHSDAGTFPVETKAASVREPPVQNERLRLTSGANHKRSEAMQTRDVHVYVFDTMADWEVGHAIGYINTPDYQKQPGRYRVRSVGRTRESVVTTGGLRITPELILAELKP